MSSSATLWTVAHQVSLSSIISQGLLKLMSIESMMPSNHLISAALFFCLQSFPASGSFTVSQLFALSGRSIGASAKVFPMNIRVDWLNCFQDRMVWYPCSPRDSQQSSPALQFKNTSSLTLLTFLMAHLWTILSKVCLCFLIHCLGLSHVSFQEASYLLISWLQSPSTVILGPKKIKSVTVSTFPSSVCHKLVGPDAMILVLWMLSFKPGFSLSSFSFIKRLFSSPSLFAIRVVLSSYLRLLIFVLATLILPFDSLSPAFSVIYSA